MPTNNRTISALGSQTQTTPVAKAIEGYIDFPDGITLPNGGTQTTGTASSDVLDWYEEGTFTPYWADATGTLPTSITYDFQKGFYQRVGNTVHFWMQLRRTDWDMSNFGGGGIRIWGLPFAAAIGGDFNSAYPSCSVSWSQDNTGSTAIAQQAEIVPGSASAGLVYYSATTPSAGDTLKKISSRSLTLADIDATGSSEAVVIYLDGMYTIV